MRHGLGPAGRLFETLRELPQRVIALAKSKPGKLSIGSYGNGHSSHLHGELLKLRAGIDLIHVPFKGASPMLTDLLGGPTRRCLCRPVQANAQLKERQAAIHRDDGTQHFKPLHNWKTLGELGYPGFDANGFMAMFVAAGTPAPIVAKLSTVIAGEVRAPRSPAASSNGHGACRPAPAGPRRDDGTRHPALGRIIRREHSHGLSPGLARMRKAPALCVGAFFFVGGVRLRYKEPYAVSSEASGEGAATPFEGSTPKVARDAAPGFRNRS